jgi:hypothetical protein
VVRRLTSRLSGPASTRVQTAMPPAPAAQRRAVRRLTVETFSRSPTDAERRQAVRGIALFHRLRKSARHEAISGQVETLRFRVNRAWNIISCTGPPCCPNSWLLETATGEYVWVESWHYLTAASAQFPGTDVTIERWAQSHRLIRASAMGSPSLTYDGTAMEHLAPVRQVEVYERGQLPDDIRTAIAGA